MSYGTPPPGGPSDSGENPPQNPGYGSAPPPPPAYGAPPPPPAYGAPQPAYGAPQPPYGGPASGEAPSPYGQAPPPYGAAPGGAAGALAQWPQRAVGWLIDFVALSIPFYVLSALSGGRGGFLYVLGVLYLIGISVWNRYLKGGSTGQTIGRGVAGVRLVSEKTGEPIGAVMAFVRDLAHLVDSVICYVGWLFPLWDSKRQTLADKIVGTVVVVAPKA
ncbi:RDD family protein [Dermatophilaceae bacterium Soc4.6]